MPSPHHREHLPQPSPTCGLLLYPFPSLPAQIDTLSSPCLLGGWAEAWGEERGTFSCEEPEATSQLAVLVAKGDPRGVGLGPGNLVLLPNEGRSVTPRTQLMLPLASEASLTCCSQTSSLWKKRQGLTLAQAPSSVPASTWRYLNTLCSCFGALNENNYL